MANSLDQHPANSHRFWNLPREKGVVAYICGHTHNYSAVRIDGEWQPDAGHARGMADTRARSTFILIHVDSGLVSFQTYRDDADSAPYALTDTAVLKGSRTNLPLGMLTGRATVSLPAKATTHH